MSTGNSETLDPVLVSVGARFDDEACDVFSHGICVVKKQLDAVPETDKHKHSESCRQLFKAGLDDWLEALVGLVSGHAEKLTKIAASYPSLVTDDPAKWITLQLKVLLSKHLRLALSFKEQRTPAVQSDRGPTYSRVAAWFRWAADEPDPNGSESAFHEPWTAPAFCDDGDFFANRREQVTVGPDRLTEEQTARIIRRAETSVVGRFDYVLRQLEHNARITIGTNGKVPFTVVDRAEMFSSPAAQGSKEKHDRSSKDILDGNGQVPWPGTARQLGDEVLEQYRRGAIAAKNERDAMERACRYFVRENGTPFKARVIIQSLVNRQNYEQNGPSKRSKALSALVKRFANVISH